MAHLPALDLIRHTVSYRSCRKDSITLSMRSCEGEKILSKCALTLAVIFTESLLEFCQNLDVFNHDGNKLFSQLLVSI